MAYRLLRRIYGWAVRTGRITLAAELLARMTRTRLPGRRYRVLCLSKTVFSQDVKALMARSQELTFLEFPRLLLSDIVRRHAPDFEALNDASYHPLLDGTEAQRRIYADMEVVFAVLCRRLRFDAVFAGNFVYVSQQEFFRVARAAGMPVVVLYKEGMIPADKTAFAGSQLLQTKRFHASRMLFYNEPNREMLLAARVPGLTREQTAVVGVPRFDDYAATDRRPPSQRHLVLFAFNPRHKAAYLLPDPSRDAAFAERLMDFQRAFVQYAQEHPSARLTIKVKTATTAMQEIREMLARSGLGDLPGNVEITNAGDPPALLREATAVAGYSSTTLLEALLLGVPVLCPELGDILPGEVMDYFHDAPEAVTRIASVEDLRTALAQPDRLKVPDRPTLERVLEPLVYRIDRGASRRVEAELVGAIVGARTPR